RVGCVFRLGRELRLARLAGPPLLKSGHRLWLAPHGIVVAPVNDGRLSGTGGEDPARGGRGRGRILTLTGERDGGEQWQPEKHERPRVEVSRLDDGTSKRVVSGDAYITRDP